MATLDIACFADLHIAQGEITEAICLLTIASNHPATEKRDKQDASHHLSLLREKVPTDIFDGAAKRGHIQSLEKAVDRLLRNKASYPLPQQKLVLHNESLK